MAAILVALNIPMDYMFLGENYEVNLSTFIILQIFFNFMKPLAIWQLIYFFFQYSKKSLLMERQNNQLERTILETEGKVLRAQMNPHFVFNALNSIRALITEDPQKAKKGINQLSKLLRSSLLTDRKKTIPLAEELNMLNLYINLEAMLLNKDFEFKLDIDKGVNQQQVKIPSLIIQPFVENAFKHGYNGGGGSWIDISLVYTQKGIEFEERKIGDGYTKEELLEAIPTARTVPQIILDGELVGGFTELRARLTEA
jgi:LytS/YehU family sensor histidine kinase